MSSGGGRMTHRRHRLVRGRPSRIGGLIDASRMLNREHEKEVSQAERKKEPMFNSVRKAFKGGRKRR